MRPRHLAIGVGVVFAAVTTSGGTVIVPAVRHAITTVSTRPAPVTGRGEAAFLSAVLRDLGAPVTAANLTSLTAWAAHEGPWGSVGQWNPLDSTQPEPGSTDFNIIAGCGCSVQNYPDASEGAQATASTIGAYPGITAALRSGGGLCGGGLAEEFSRWSGDGYTQVC